MSLKYYPSTRITTNRYTRGGEFVLSNGRAYTGRYYTIYTGESFTGVNPIVGTNEPLFAFNSSSRLRVANAISSVITNGTLNTTNGTLNYNAVESSINVLNEKKALTELTPYFPVAIEDDYQRGYFTRYFAKTVSGPGYVFEISRLDWTKIQDGNVSDTVLGYETIDMLWQLTGPLNNVRVSQYQIKGGVYDTNKRVTETKNKVFRGLLEFIGGDYIKFARITP